VPVDPWRHVLAPLIGAGIIGYVMVKADVAAKTVGLVWLGVGILALIGLQIAGRRPSVAALEEA
jgi:hypothetical protein